MDPEVKDLSLNLRKVLANTNFSLKKIEIMT